MTDYPPPFDGHSESLLVQDTLEQDDRWVDHGSPSGQLELPAGVATEKGKTCSTNMVSIHKAVNEQNVMVSVEAFSHSEAGIVLRYKDLNNYVVALYNPHIKAIYILDRRKGAWGPFFAYRIPHLGIVDVPEVGPKIQLTAAVCRDYAALLLSDGKRSYYTPAVKIRNVKCGKTGLWRSDIGQPQKYINFKVSKTPFSQPPGNRTLLDQHLIRSGEDVAPATPSPQDWVLVLEREKH